MTTTSPEPESKSALVLTTGWGVFGLGMIAAAAVDVLFVSRPSQSKACCYQVYVKQILFWLIAGLAFMLFIAQVMGAPEAGSWIYGYFLEYTLSIDNLFVFQMVFKSYSTPESQVGRALFWGIAVAVVLRMAFFGVGTEVLNLGLAARLFFGLVLVYSGYKTLRDSDDGDDDPSQNLLIRSVSRLLPLHEHYGDEPVFFVWVPPSPDSLPDATVMGSPQPSHELHSILERDEDVVTPTAAAPDEKLSRGSSSSDAKLTCKVTPLFLVVLTLGVIDVVFAVDSVTAKISSVLGFDNEVSFFLNLTSSAFAMWVLRSLYLVVDMLTHMFRFLKYGVGSVLILIGVKLMLSGYVEVGMLASSLLILAMLALPILASILIPVPAEEKEASVSEQDAHDGDGCCRRRMELS
mmetsp:Transcript_77781/g.137175  ORF Transcript_77781/g.137175 Transcript_77781/m.137175 type:complete len:406 (+) Transcript_77781:47-1264(+)